MKLPKAQIGLKLTPKVRTNIKFIIFAVKQTKEAQKFGFTLNHCCRNLKIALHQYWQNKTLGLHNTAQKKRIPRSKAALKKPLHECRVEHSVPLTVIVNRLVQMKHLSTVKVFRLLKDFYAVRLVTRKEDILLTKKGLRFDMPSDWNGKNIFARYEAVGIECSETE